jgi:hypothetical protein
LLADVLNVPFVRVTTVPVIVSAAPEVHEPPAPSITISRTDDIVPENVIVFEEVAVSHTVLGLKTVPDIMLMLP